MENFIFCAVKELNGVILSQYHFRTHLHNNNKAINEELEPQNFEYAGELFANWWWLCCCWINRRKPSDLTNIKSEEWKSNHVRESQYLLQIVEFTDKALHYNSHI